MPSGTRLSIVEKGMARHFIVFFASGSAFYFWFVWRYLFPSIGGGQIATQAERESLATVFALLGGLALAWFMQRMMLKMFASSHVPRWRRLVSSGGYGVLGAGVPTLLICVLFSAIFAAGVSGATEAVSWPLRLYFSLLGAMTYGMAPLIPATLCGFVYGVGTAYYALLVRRTAEPLQPPGKEPTAHSQSSPALSPAPIARGRLALGLAVAGLMLFLVPLVGTGLSVASLIISIKALRTAAASDSRGKGEAITALVLSALCVLYLLVGFGVLLRPKR